MKKILILLVIAVGLVMGGCAEEPIYPKHVKVAEYICDGNDGYKAFRRTADFYDNVEVYCKDGAVYEVTARGGKNTVYKINGNTDEVANEIVNGILQGEN